MKAISWNVNGLRACLQKGFLDFFQAEDADFFCLQETKLQEGQVALELPGYHQFWNYAQKKGYSGTAIFSKLPPLSVSYGLGIPELDTEGRVITLEFDNFYLVTCYTPNAQQALARLDFRLEWEKAFSQYLVGLDQKKPVVVCGDLNVAHQEIDLKNPAATGATPDSPMRSGNALRIYWPPVSRTPSGCCTRMLWAVTVGGATASKPGKTTPDGGLTIF